MRRVGVAVVAALLAVVVLVAASLALLVVRSLVGDENDDPHGYGLIFGSVALVIMVPIGLVLLGLLRSLTRSVTRRPPA